MSVFITKRKAEVAGLWVATIIFVVSSYTELTAESPSLYEQGLVCYERNEMDKAVKFFKESLAAYFTEPASGKLKEAIELAQNGKADESKKILTSLFDNEDAASRAMYELGLIYESQGKLDDAAFMFRNAQLVIANDNASYVGSDKCKICHIKEYKSWKTTKMSKTFEVLKPGIEAEAKTKLNFDPQKDYTKDTKCLECHTTGFGLPGGYKIPQADDSASVKRAKENEGTTCEACHGPGSKYADIHKQIMTKKRKYTFDELSQAGEHKADAKSCTACHNRRNPTAGPDFHFDYEKYKAEDTHENFPLKYRAKE